MKTAIAAPMLLVALAAPAAYAIDYTDSALVGDHLDNRDSYAVAVTRPVQYCQTVQELRQVLTGYQVTYYYNGRNTTVVLPYDPGPRVPIAIGIAGSTPRYIGPATAQIAYSELRLPRAWEIRPYRRHGRHHDDHDRDD